MRDNKAFASLSSGLLARKGQARPAMRPQGFVQGAVQTDDLGWNDMGHDVPRIAGAILPAGLADGSPILAAPAIPDVIRQQAEIAREFAAPAVAEPAAIEPVAIEPAAIEYPALAADGVEPIDAARIDAKPVLVSLVTATPAEEPIDDAPVATPVDFVPAAKAPPRRSAKRREPVPLARTDSRKAAFTLRLEAERHLLLRLACAVQNRSAQQIVVEALDRLLADLPDVKRLAASLPHHD